MNSQWAACPNTAIEDLTKLAAGKALWMTSISAITAKSSVKHLSPYQIAVAVKRTITNPESLKI
jgi:hypothetical protein